MDIKRPLVLFAILLAVTCVKPSSSAEENGGDEQTVNKILRDIEGGPVIPYEANRIYIPLFENRTGKDGLPEKLRERIREAISKDRRLAVVDDVGISDLRLDGIITGYQIQNMTFNAIGVVEKKRMRITASVKLLKTVSRKVIFNEADIQSFREFSDTVPPILDESRVFEVVIDELAKRITANTLSGWYTERMTPVEKGKSK